MGSLRGLRLAAGNFFRLYEKDAASSLRFTRNFDLKRVNGFCTKPQETPKAPSCKFVLVLYLSFPHCIIRFEMLDAAKNKIRVKVSYIMIALTVVGCILMIIEGKKAAKRNESLTSLNLEKKARLREEAAMKAKTE
ncbi:protein FAM162A [Marmota marmota marmota]|uniref:protein FAM162A n=1 Tax=Marmota marmota marmota TaxID=9994 RepID=UPI000762565F|nr:protein FAM162A [Marmota marmota marmota]